MSVAPGKKDNVQSATGKDYASTGVNAGATKTTKELNSELFLLRTYYEGGEETALKAVVQESNKYRIMAAKILHPRDEDGKEEKLTPDQKSQRDKIRFMVGGSDVMAVETLANTLKELDADEVKNNMYRSALVSQKGSQLAEQFPSLAGSIKKYKDKS